MFSPLPPLPPPAPGTGNSTTAILDDSEVVQSLKLYGSLVLVSVITYSLLRAYFPRLLAPRHKSTRDPTHTRAGPSYLGWIKCAFTSAGKDEDLAERLGMDAFASIRLIRFCLILTCLYSVIGMSILVPLYFSQATSDDCLEYCHDKSKGTTDQFRARCVCEMLDRMSLANLPFGSQLLYVPSLFTVALTLITLRILDAEYHRHVRTRQNFWKRRPPQLYSVLVNEIPPVLRSRQNLYEYFERLFPGSVHKIEMAGVDSSLELIGEQRAAVLAQLEHALAWRAKNEGKDPMHWQYCVRSPECAWWVKTQSIPEYSRNLERLNSSFASLHHAHMLAQGVRQSARYNQNNNSQDAPVYRGVSGTNYQPPREVNEHPASAEEEHEEQWTSGFPIHAADSNERTALMSSPVHNHGSTYDEHLPASPASSASSAPREGGRGRSQYRAYNDTSIMFPASEPQGADEMGPPPPIPKRRSRNAGILGAATAAINTFGAGLTNRLTRTRADPLLDDDDLNNLDTTGGIDTAGFGNAGGRGSTWDSGRYENPVERGDEDENEGITAGNKVAFVTFNSVFAAATCAQAVLHTSTDLQVGPAPEPTDIVWSNLGIQPTLRVGRKLFVRFTYLILVLFWGVLTAAVASLTSTEALADQFPAVKRILIDSPYLVTLIDQLAPLLLIIIISLVNPILSWLAGIEGGITWSRIDHAVTNRYFWFLVIQIFLFYGISGTVFKTFVEIIEQPRSIVSTLASTIPKNSAFYIQFIVVKMFSSLCTELLRIPVLAISALRSILWGPPLTERERRTGYCGGCCWHASFPSPSNLTHKNAQNLLVFFIATTYAAIQPWILVAAVVFFALAYAVAVTDFTGASKQVYDSGGTYWPHAFWCMVASLMCGQLTLVGVVTIKGGYGASLPLWVCVLFTMGQAYLIESRYKPQATNIPLLLARRLDQDANKNADGRPRVVQVQTPRWQYNAVYGVDSLDNGIGGNGSIECGEGAGGNVFMGGGVADDRYTTMENRQFAAAGVYKYLQPVLCEEETVMPLDGVHQDELCGYMPLAGVDGLGAIVAPTLSVGSTSSLSVSDTGMGHEEEEEEGGGHVGESVASHDGPW